jgi:hypothetical protein
MNYEEYSDRAVKRLKKGERKAGLKDLQKSYSLAMKAGDKDFMTIAKHYLELFSKDPREYEEIIQEEHENWKLQKRIRSIEGFLSFYQDPEWLRRLTIKGLKKNVARIKSKVKNLALEGHVSAKKKKELLVRLEDLVNIRLKYPQEPVKPEIENLNDKKFFEVGILEPSAHIEGSQPKEEKITKNMPAKISAPVHKEDEE